ncbi:hypothetical protein [Mycoplana dimorpha]|uniref:hypothetical protein n=1 Tax=Mycoplana dimorpha TaxID=28320 RepID=UPI000D3B504D|nr:hypothetical protein [Mycoplana dimorpha]
MDTRELAAAGEYSEEGESFASPEGYTVDYRSAEIDRIARQHMNQHGGTYAEAARYAETRVTRT